VTLSDSASSKRSGSSAPGTPIQPGQVLNPKGNNQYTYRRDFETAISALLSGNITEEHIAFLPEHIRPLIQERTDMSRGEVIALVTVTGALQGDEKQLADVLKRLWPVTEKRELTGADGAPLPPAVVPVIDMTVYSDEERESLQGFIHRQLQAKTEGPDE